MTNSEMLKATSGRDTDAMVECDSITEECSGCIHRTLHEPIQTDNAHCDTKEYCHNRKIEVQCI